jgi:hypothetical protein
LGTAVGYLIGHFTYRVYGPGTVHSPRLALDPEAGLVESGRLRCGDQRPDLLAGLAELSGGARGKARDRTWAIGAPMRGRHWTGVLSAPEPAP